MLEEICPGSHRVIDSTPPQTNFAADFTDNGEGVLNTTKSDASTEIFRNAAIFVPGGVVYYHPCDKVVTCYYHGGHS